MEFVHCILFLCRRLILGLELSIVFLFLIGNFLSSFFEINNFSSGSSAARDDVGLINLQQILLFVVQIFLLSLLLFISVIGLRFLFWRIVVSASSSLLFRLVRFFWRPFLVRVYVLRNFWRRFGFRFSSFGTIGSIGSIVCLWNISNFLLWLSIHRLFLCFGVGHFGQEIASASSIYGARFAI
ncbi:predicted protein [Clavispora lusitaniae ATCC 42720]|uniref:Uncharacterized protein n=1 Tax=Clavispora lusitaniae (strain ATCC 42720) TaxID=306902 RepID=C4XWN9_CLAL4|nr:uncharacterized protein CLUG_00362 [Clavispora lusitaniae ATCC 42720]EEQ36239.1 predicted protein [Clavispora lusitaniae ATCC 42720]